MRTRGLAATALVGALSIYTHLSGIEITHVFTNVMPFPATVTVAFPDRDGWTVETRLLEPGAAAEFIWRYPRAVDRVYDLSIEASGEVAESIYGKPLQIIGDVEHVVDGRPLSFTRYVVEDEEGEEGLLIAPDPNDPELMLTPWADTLEATRQQAIELSQVLIRRMPFVAAWLDKAMPILPGAVFWDDSAYAPGVAIADAAEVTPLSAPIGFRRGDVVLSINDEAIYGESDAFRLLLDHVNTQTAARAIRFTALRDGQMVIGTSGVYFNDDVFIPSSGDIGETVLRSALRMLALATGLDVVVECWLRDQANDTRNASRCRIDARNRQLLLAQQHQTADLVGGIIGIPVPILRPALARVLPAGRAGRAAATVLGESLEWGIVAANEAPAGVNPISRGVAAAPWGAGIGLVIARVMK